MLEVALDVAAQLEELLSIVPSSMTSTRRVNQLTTQNFKSSMMQNENKYFFILSFFSHKLKFLK
jgi:hypothetical protein